MVSNSSYIHSALRKISRFFVIAVVCLGFLNGCGGSREGTSSPAVRVMGQLLDQFGSPVSGALIEVIDDQVITTVTDDNGDFDVDVPRSGQEEKTLRVTSANAEGSLPLILTAQVDTVNLALRETAEGDIDIDNIDIELTPDDEPDPALDNEKAIEPVAPTSPKSENKDDNKKDKKKKQPKPDGKQPEDKDQEDDSPEPEDLSPPEEDQPVEPPAPDGQDDSDDPAPVPDPDDEDDGPLDISKGNTPADPPDEMDPETPPGLDPNPDDSDDDQGGGKGFGDWGGNDDGDDPIPDEAQEDPGKDPPGDDLGKGVESGGGPGFGRF